MTLRSGSPVFKFGVVTARFVHEKLEPWSKQVDFGLDARTIVLEHGVYGHQDIAALGLIG